MTTGARAPDQDRVSFLERRIPPAFERRVISIAPGLEYPYDEAEWRDAVVVVERSVVELEGVSGRRDRLEPGAVLWLVELPLRALHNRGREPAVLAAVSRKSPHHR